ncbi:potassium channel, subfamily K, member 16-like [Dasypus novemcinctus]|uniref:potassium channel, subfamily K, member 16-like n=1 Tax=Dasypus novemcinctus TaxID=9361 RepID=UPI00265F6268|nr:potassium channel subfamily K member 16-like [Dasypus novemcinctus]
MSLHYLLSSNIDLAQSFEASEELNTNSQKGILLLAYCLYLLLGGMIFQTLEKDFEVERRELAVRMKTDFLNNRSNKTQEDVELFVQEMTSLILSGIPPIGNNTSAIFWNLRNSFLTSSIILSTIGYGLISPRTADGQMFCVVFAAIGIPLSIIFFKVVGKSISLPYEKFGDYLEHKGIKEKNANRWKALLFIVTGSLLFLVLPPFVFMSLENWTYVEGIYYTFTTISTIGFGDYTIVSNPAVKRHPIYSISLTIWKLCGLVWIALVFNLITNFLQEMETKLRHR